MRSSGFESQQYHVRRLFLYISLVIFGFVPTIHWATVSPSSEVSLFLWQILVFYILLGTGVVFYVTKFPESKFPGFSSFSFSFSFSFFFFFFSLFFFFNLGHFDYILSSHQLWHMFVLVGIYWWYTFAIDIFIFRKSNPDCLEESDDMIDFIS